MATTPGSEASIIFGKGYHFRPAGLHRPPRLGGVRHRSGPREFLSHGVEVKRGLPRSRSSRPFLRLVCRVQRPGRQRLATPGDYDAVARPIDPAAATFDSASDLASALRRAAAAHGEHEKRLGKADPNWPDWYAEYMVAEQAGTEPPQ
jgi:hypothetical protein